MNTTLRAFHNDPKIKAKYVERLARHREQEQLIQGQGWDGTKGCAVGCTLEQYSHESYPIELGLPEWLARLEDVIFERLSKEDAEKFAVDFLEVIPVGACVEGVRTKLAILRQQGNLKRLEGNKDSCSQRCRVAIQGVIDWHLGGEQESKRSAARSAAYSAAYSADSAADSAARSAAYSARSAAYSAAYSADSAADSAARSADSAAYSARSAAYSAAYSAARVAHPDRTRRAIEAAQEAHYMWEARTLLSLLEETEPK